MRNICLLIILLTASLFSTADTNELEQCGIEIHYLDLGVEKELFELLVKIDQTKIDFRKCEKLENIGLSNFASSEWTIFDVSDSKVEVSFRRTTQFIENLELSLRFKKEGNATFFSDKDNYYRISITKLAKRN